VSGGGGGGVTLSFLTGIEMKCDAI